MLIQHVRVRGTLCSVDPGKRREVTNSNFQSISANSTDEGGIYLISGTVIS